MAEVIDEKKENTDAEDVKQEKIAPEEIAPEEVAPEEVAPEETQSWGTQALERVQAELRVNRLRLKKAQKDRRTWMLIFICAVIFLVLHYSGLLPLTTWIKVFVWIIGVFFLLATIGSDVEKWRAEIESLEYAEKSYEGFRGIRGEATYFDSLVQINVTNLGEYYSLVKIHTNQSFKTCIFAGCIGFLLVVLGVAIGFFKQDLKDVSYLAAGTGIITEFISGVFFYLYNKTVRQLKEYHDSLLEIQNVLMSFKLIDGLKEQGRKAEMIKCMIQFLVGRSGKVEKPKKQTEDV